MSEPGFPPSPGYVNPRSGNPPVSLSAYGRGFYLLIRSQFTEVNQSKILLQTIETALNKSCLDATQQLSQSFTMLGPLCSCEVCGSNGLTIGEDDSFCLKLLIQTIWTLARIMSACCTQQKLNILPARSGIERIYWNLKLERAELRRLADHENVVKHAILRPWAQHDSLTWMQILFTGRGDDDQYNDMSTNGSIVATRNGLCFCLNTLIEVTSDPQRACVVTVVPGKIEWNDSIYHHVRDLEHDPQIARDGPYSAISATVITQYDDLADSSSADLQAELIVEETTAERRVLDTTYRITTPEFPGKCFLVGPRKIWDNLNDAFTAASCQGEICQPLTSFQSILVKGEGLLYPVTGWQDTYLPITRILPSQDLAVWAAHSQTHLASSNEIPIELSHTLQGEQCVRCSIVGSEDNRLEDTCFVTLITSI